MSEILSWLSEYSLPVVLLIVLGAALLYLVKLITEKGIAHQFDHYSKTLALQLQRRSNFEERVLLERYSLLRELHSKVNAVLTNLNRMRDGTEIEGFMRNGDIVPLTEVFETIQANRYLIPEPFLAVLDRQAKLALEAARAQNDQHWGAVGHAVQDARREFDRLMVEEFQLNRIGGLD